MLASLFIYDRQETHLWKKWQTSLDTKFIGFCPYFVSAHLAAEKVFLPLPEITSFPILRVTILSSFKSIFCPYFLLCNNRKRDLWLLNHLYEDPVDLRFVCDGTLPTYLLPQLLHSVAQPLSQSWGCHCPWPLGETSGKPGSLTPGLLCPLFGGQPGSPSALWDINTNFAWLEKSHTILISVSRPFCTSFSTSCHINSWVNPTHHSPESHCCWAK